MNETNTEGVPERRDNQLHPEFKVGQKWRCRDGKVAEILKIAAREDFPILALIDGESYRFDRNGVVLSNPMKNIGEPWFDLVELIEDAPDAAPAKPDMNGFIKELKDEGRQTLFELTICGPIQSGKTTMALGALERLRAAGVCVAYVVPTREMALQSTYRTVVPCVACNDAVNSPNKQWRAVVVDDTERCPSDVIDLLRRILSDSPGPTQLILVKTSNTSDLKYDMNELAAETLQSLGWHFDGTCWVQDAQPEQQSALDVQVDGNHYKDCAIQPVEFIHANGLDFFQGNIIKYATRHKAKNGAADLRKAIHYCQLALQLQYGEVK